MQLHDAVVFSFFLMIVLKLISPCHVQNLSFNLLKYHSYQNGTYKRISPKNFDAFYQQVVQDIHVAILPFSYLAFQTSYIIT